MNLHKRNILLEPRARTASLACASLAFVLATVGGCKSADKKDDPLFGVKPPQVNPVPPATGAQSRATVPPIPGSTSGGSTAALASLPNGRPLSINAPAPPGPARTTGGPSVQPIPREAPAAPGLLTTGAWGQQLPTITPNLPPSSAESSGDAVFAPLQSRGVTAHFVSNTADGVQLRVLAPHRATPGAVRVYEAEARDLPAAVQAVVQQIDQQRN